LPSKSPTFAAPLVNGQWSMVNEIHSSTPLPPFPPGWAAGVAKLVDVSDLGSDAARHGGSSPSTRTERRRISNKEQGSKNVEVKPHFEIGCSLFVCWLLKENIQQGTRSKNVEVKPHFEIGCSLFVCWLLKKNIQQGTRK
jgi:hypothetical protein